MNDKYSEFKTYVNDNLRIKPINKTSNKFKLSLKKIFGIDSNLHNEKNDHTLLDYLDDEQLNDYYQKFFDLYLNQQKHYFKFENVKSFGIGIPVHVLWFNLKDPQSDLELKAYLAIDETYQTISTYETGYSHPSFSEINWFCYTPKNNQNFVIDEQQQKLIYKTNFQDFDQKWQVWGEGKVEIAKIFDPSVIIRFQKLNPKNYYQNVICFKKDFVYFKNVSNQNNYLQFDLNLNQEFNKIYFIDELTRKIVNDFTYFYKNKFFDYLKGFDFYEDYQQVKQNIDNQTN